MPNATTLRRHPARQFFFLLILFLWLLTSCRAAPSADPAALVCESYCVGEPFADFYSLNGGAKVFGEPISGVMEWPQDPTFISQYFESMRLDYYRQSAQVEIADLGVWAFEGLAESERLEMAGTTHPVASPFTDFYAAHRGELIFGQPLSPLLQEGSLRVQYFEHGRLEWQPGLSTTSGLYSGSIGRAHFDQTAFRYEILAIPADGPPDQVNLAAVVSSPILYDGEPQTFYVQALSPAQAPADNLVVEIEIGHADQPIVLSGLTDADGWVEITLEPDDIDLTPGQRLAATVRAYGIEQSVLGETLITFETWW